MKGSGPIELSAIVVTPSDMGAIEATLEALRAQTARERIEVVVVAPGPIAGGEGELDGFAAGNVVTSEFDTLGQAIATGMLAASGSVVAYAEEHSQPSPGWAEVLIERHKGPWTAVSWGIENANPATTASWAHLLTDFGPGVVPIESGERDGPMPWHHVSYKRADLEPYGDRLAVMIETEGLLQQELLDRGGRFFADGSVSSKHLNISRLRWNMRCHFLGGRGFGSARASLGGWSAGRRLAYAIGFPLVPVIRLARMRPDVIRTKATHTRLRGLTASLTVNLFLDALGEAVGYLFGDGPARKQRLTMELERKRFLGRGDAPALPQRVSAEAAP